MRGGQAADSADTSVVEEGCGGYRRLDKISRPLPASKAPRRPARSVLLRRRLNGSSRSPGCCSRVRDWSFVGGWGPSKGEAAEGERPAHAPKRRAARAGLPKWRSIPPGRAVERAGRRTLAARRFRESESGVVTYLLRTARSQRGGNTINSVPADGPVPLQAPKEVLEWPFRAPLVIEELMRADADVICLEELNHFREIADRLQGEGFAGVFHEKVRENPVTFHGPQRLRAATRPRSYTAETPLSSDSAVELALRSHGLSQGRDSALLALVSV